MDSQAEEPQENSCRRHDWDEGLYRAWALAPLARELKDFIQDRVGLPWDEFNRVPVAGVTSIARLGPNLDP
jgi:hypothetical protein